MTRRMPVQCKHGRVSDWGDFGQDGAEPEPCYYCRKTAGRDEMRDLVYRGIVKQGRGNAGLRAVLEPLGFFTFMDLVDAISDSIEDAYASGTPLALVNADTDADIDPRCDPMPCRNCGILAEACTYLDNYCCPNCAHHHRNQPPTDTTEAPR